MSDPITLTEAEWNKYGYDNTDGVFLYSEEGVAQIVAARLAEVTAERKLWYDRAGDVLAALRNAEAERDALRARIEAAAKLADSWVANSNNVSKFIDADHADDLRAALNTSPTV